MTRYDTERGKGRSIPLPSFYLNQQALGLTVKTVGERRSATRTLWKKEKSNNWPTDSSRQNTIIRDTNLEKNLQFRTEVSVAEHFHPIRMTSHIYPEPYFLAAPKIEESPGNSLRNTQWERTSYRLLLNSCSTIIHYEESHLVYGPLCVYSRPGDHS